MSSPRQDPVPAFLSVDVEPDAFQTTRDDAQAWPGYGTLFEFSRGLRAALARVSGSKPRVGWYFRMDPQVAEICGRADDAVKRFPDRFASLQDEGDYFGVHTHPLRWSAERRLWVHDVQDRAWVRGCMTSSLDAFESTMGSPVRRHRAGASFLNEDIVDILDERGVDLELSLEPVSGWLLGATPASTRTGTPIEGSYVDCGSAPRTPYRPERGDFRLRGGASPRRITLVPLSTAPRRLPARGWSLRLRRLLRRVQKPRSVHVLHPTADWPSERYFWDLVAYQLDRMERPYLSLSVRTDAPRAEATEKVIRLFSALPRHPLAKRLRFVDPLGAIDRILPREPVPTVGTS